VGQGSPEVVATLEAALEDRAQIVRAQAEVALRRASADPR